MVGFVTPMEYLFEYLSLTLKLSCCVEFLRGKISGIKGVGCGVGCKMEFIDEGLVRVFSKGDK